MLINDGSPGYFHKKQSFQNANSSKACKLSRGGVAGVRAGGERACDHVP